MAPERTEAILSAIDKVVGTPEEETPEERAKRAEMVERRARRKALGLPS